MITTKGSSVSQSVKNVPRIHLQSVVMLFSFILYVNKTFRRYINCKAEGRLSRLNGHRKLQSCQIHNREIRQELEAVCMNIYFFKSETDTSRKSSKLIKIVMFLALVKFCSFTLSFRVNPSQFP